MQVHVCSRVNSYVQTPRFPTFLYTTVFIIFEHLHLFPPNYLTQLWPRAWCLDPFVLFLKSLLQLLHPGSCTDDLYSVFSAQSSLLNSAFVSTIEWLTLHLNLLGSGTEPLLSPPHQLFSLSPSFWLMVSPSLQVLWSQIMVSSLTPLSLILHIQYISKSIVSLS